MEVNNFTVLLYTKNDALEFLKSNKELKYFRIYPLTPDAYSIIKDKYKDKICILPNNYFTNYSHKKVVATVKRLESRIFPILARYKFKDYIEETIKHLIHFSLSSAFYLWFSIKGLGPWVIYDGKKWNYILDLNIAFRIFYFRIYTEMQPNFFGQIPYYKPKFQILLQIINNLSIRLFIKNQSIWLTGESYRLKEISEKIKISNDEISTINLIPFQRMAIFNFIKSFLVNSYKLFMKRKLNNVSLLPIASSSNSYQIEITEIFNKIDDKRINNISDFLIKNYCEITNYLTSIEDSVTGLVEKTNPKCLVAHQLKIGDAIVLGSIFKKNNTDIHLISHGSHPETDNLFAKFELNDNAQGLLVSRFSNNVYLQSKSAKNAIKGNDYKFNEIITAPIMWGRENFKNKNKNKRFTILHAGTPKPLGTRPYIYETSFEYLTNIQNIIDHVSFFEDIDLIIRFRSAAEFSKHALLKLLKVNENVKIKFGGNFYDDLEKSDFLISFASTTIEEALYQYKPVGLYGSKERFWHLNNRKNSLDSNLRYAIYHLTDKNFYETIKKIKNLHFNKPLEYQELKQYIWDMNTSNITDFVDDIT